MSFKPCLLIPIYNHGSSIRRTVEALVTYQLPIFIVDDGSDLDTQRVLDELAHRITSYNVCYTKLLRMP